MIQVQLKLIDEGVHADLDALTVSLRYHLAQDQIFIDGASPLTLKIKFMQDNGQDKVLIVLRETESKEKLGEKVLPFVSDRWLRDVPNEAHALVANLVVHAA
jgi:hypothetical protein